MRTRFHFVTLAPGFVDQSSPQKRNGKPARQQVGSKVAQIDEEIEQGGQCYTLHNIWSSCLQAK
jgi:hypothetical protein